MKKMITIMLCLILALSMVACGNTGTPDNKGDFEDAQKSFDDIESSTNKSEIEKTIKNVFGVDISLPNAESYSADKMELSGSSMYIILVTGSDKNAEEYYNSVKSKFSKWTALDGSKSFSYETEKVTYGCVITNDGESLSITFSTTDKELIDAFKDFVGDTSTFRTKIKELSGLDINFPEIVTSVGLPSENSVGSKAYYTGMLLAGGGNLDATGFQTVIDALTPQLTGYTKSEPVQGTNTTTVTWTNNNDSEKFFKIVLSDYDGSTWVDFSFNYTDRSLLDPWPNTELESFFGVANALPEYAGDYRSLEVTYNPENNANYFEIELSGSDEEEFNAWVALLTTAGFASESVEQSWGDPITQYTKEVSEGVFVTVIPRSYGYGGGEIRIEKVVYTDLNWPTEALVTAYGQQAANAIPQIDKASKRSFIFEEGTYYDTLKVENNSSEELFDDYCSALVTAGFELTDSSTYSKRNSYEKVFDNWDKLRVVVEYGSYSYGSDDALELEITFTEYTGFGIELPENAEIVYTTTMTIGESSGSSESRIIKIGESYYMSGVYRFDAYYRFNEEARTWTVYNGTKNDDGTVTWEIEEENVSRTSVDTMLGQGFQTLSSKAEKADPARTASYQNVTCTEYTYSVSYGASYSYDYVYWVDENTNLVFDYLCTYDGGSTRIAITTYNTNVTSFGDVALPE